MTGDDRGSANGAPRLLREAAAAHATARERVSSAAIDLFLPLRTRLSDYQRSTVSRLIDALVAEVEGELRAALAPALRQVASAELALGMEAVRVPIAAPILARAGALADPDLIALLILRADEERAARTLRLEADAAETPPPLERWLRGEDREVAGAVSALMIADARRFAPAREPLLPRAELPAELQHMLIWRVAAALRHHLLEAQGLAAAEADRLLAAAATAALAAFDEGDAACARALQLVRLLGDRLDDAALLALVEGGELLLAAAGLAERTRIALGPALEMLIDPAGGRAALLLAAAGVSREAGAAMLVRVALAGGLDDERAVACAEALAAIERADAAEAVRPFGLDRDYRAAIELVERGTGGERLP